MIEASEYTTGLISQLTCLRCTHKWFPQRPVAPAHCPKCNSPYWNKTKGNNTNRLDPEKAQEYPVHCFRCNHDWKTILKRPTQCPKCHSSYWDKPKQDKLPTNLAEGVLLVEGIKPIDPSSELNTIPF